MSKKENFKRELRRFRRRWFPTAKEREEKRSFTENLIKAGESIDFYFRLSGLKKG